MLQTRTGYKKYGAKGWLWYLNKGACSNNGLYISTSLLKKIYTDYNQLYRKYQESIRRLRSLGVKVKYKYPEWLVIFCLCYYHYFYFRLCVRKFRIFYKLYIWNRISSSFISKCFEPVNLSQNTSINKPKSTRGKQIRINVIKPIPNKWLESGGQKQDI